MKGQIISGQFGKILVRQKQDAQIEIGELLIAENDTQKQLLQAIDLTYGSQISQQNLELISGMHLEDNQDIHIYDRELRNYTLAALKTLLTINKTSAKSAKTLPQFFTKVRAVKKEDLTFLPKPEHGFLVGNMRSGSQVIDLPIQLDIQKVLSHHILIPATTGKGKSNLMSVILWELLSSDKCATLVLDPHDEYYGRNEQKLKDHPQFSEKGVYYSQNAPPGGVTLKINITQLHPRHFIGVADFTQPQFELLNSYYTKHQKHWVEQLFIGDAKIHMDNHFHEGTIGVTKRRLSQLLDIEYINDSLQCNGIYDLKKGDSTISDIVKSIQEAKTVIIDTSYLSGNSEIFLGSIITNAILDTYKYNRSQGIKAPVCSIVLEEAPRVIGKDVLDKGTNVFGTIAKEGRKFNVGLCAITQLPSLIPKDILANMNTKIILGIEMAQERNAIIESAAQDLSDDSRNIASLDKGEAIITSNFTRFAIPIKIPLFTVQNEQKVNRKLSL